MIKAFTIGLIMGAVLGVLFGVLLMAVMIAGKDDNPSEINENAPESDKECEFEELRTEIKERLKKDLERF